MRINLFLRHFLSYTLIIVCTTMLIGLIGARQFKKSYLKTLEAGLEKEVQVISSSIKDLLVKGHYRQVDSMVTALAQKINTRITVIRSDGYVIGESDHDTKTMEDHSTRTEFIQALQTGCGKKIRWSETTGQDMLYVALAVTDMNKVIAVVRVSTYLSQINKDLRSIDRKVIVSSLILMVLALIFAFWTSRNLTQPVRTLTNAAEKIKKGDFNTRIITQRKDEVGQLTESLNNMAESLNNLFTGLETERAEIKLILASMADGLVVIDHREHISLSNDVFNKIVGYRSDEILRKYYWQIIKSVQFGDFIKQIQQSGSGKTCEIEINNKVYLVNASWTSHIKDKKIIIVMHDITEAKRLEQVKADFIANVSHELKTPLTSIKGFADTLAEEVSKKYQKFAETISRNADRLINIVQDLLVISELERKEQQLQIEAIDLAVMLDNLKKVFATQLKAKKLKLQITIDSAAQHIQGDYFLTEQVMTNLIDNAIKYNIEKGKINISVDKIDNKSRIIVEDKGIGIAEEHLSRIFERFYVVDKSRSRKLGGTGLGLSIVKHIVLSHNGEITVESEVSKGTKFIITLPGS